jgi:hypothetical protein
LGLPVFVAFTVNYFSSTGIALTGQWDVSKVVIMAKTKNDVVLENWEIEDIKAAKKIYDTKQAIFVVARVA